MRDLNVPLHFVRIRPHHLTCPPSYLRYLPALAACGVAWSAAEKVALFVRGRTTAGQGSVEHHHGSSSIANAGASLHSSTRVYPAARHPVVAITAFACYPVRENDEGVVTDLRCHAALLLTELARCMHAAQVNSCASPQRLHASLALRAISTVSDHAARLAHAHELITRIVVEGEDDAPVLDGGLLGSALGLPAVQQRLRVPRPSLVSFINGLDREDVDALVAHFTQVRLFDLPLTFHANSAHNLTLSP